MPPPDSSPFKRRPALSKTYASKRTSGGTNGSRRSTGASNSILDDSSDEHDEGRSDAKEISSRRTAGQRRDKGKERERDEGREEEEEQLKGSAPARSKSATRSTASATPTSTTAPTRPPPARRIRSSTLVPSPPLEPRPSPPPSQRRTNALERTESSRLWDETAAVVAAKSIQPRRSIRGKRGKDVEGEEGGEEEAAVSTKRTNGKRGHDGQKGKGKEKEGATAADDEAATENVEPSSPPPPRKRTRLSRLAAPSPDKTDAPAATVVEGERNKKKRNSPPEEEEDDDDDEDAIPAPFDYVPLAERMARSASGGEKAKEVGVDKPRPRRGTPSAPPAQPPHPPQPHVAVTPPKEDPAPALQPAVAVAAVPRPPPALAPTPAPAPAVASKRPPPPRPQPARPASPAKDLSALFSRFSSSTATNDQPSASSHPPPHASLAPRSPLKRSATSVDVGMGGMVGRMKAGRRNTGGGRERGASVVPEGDEDVEEDLYSNGGGRSASASPSKPRSSHPTLDRSVSQPTLPSSPLASAHHSPVRGMSPSPARPALHPFFSFPGIDPARGGSPLPNAQGSPRRAALSRSVTTVAASGSTQGRGYGYALPGGLSVYAPQAAFTATTLSGAAGAGGGRTYAGGARSFKRDLGEEAFLAGPSKGRGGGGGGSGLDASLSSSPHPSQSHPHHLLSGLPPALRRPQPPAARNGNGNGTSSYSTLRSLWGVDAEESLDASEETESQERGAKVEGGDVLRRRGEGKRWGDEVGFLLDGLREGQGEGEDRGAGRASALELLQKMLDKEWSRRLKASGMAEGVYTAFRRAGAGEGRDKVLDTSLLVLLALLLRDQRLSEPLFRLSPTDIHQPASTVSPRPSSPAGAVGGTPRSRPTSPAVSRHNSYSTLSRSATLPNLDLDSQPQSDLSAFPSFSSSPRKRPDSSRPAAALGVRDDRSDLMEVVKSFLGAAGEDDGVGERGWLDGEIGNKGVGEGEEGRGKKGKGGRGKRDGGEGRYMQSLRNVIDEAGLFAGQETAGMAPTPLALLLHLTHSLSSFTPRTIFQPQHLLCLSGAFEVIVRRGVVDECGKIEARIEAYVRGLDLLPSASTASRTSVPCLRSLLLTLRILDLVSASTPLALPTLSNPSFLLSLATSIVDLTLFAHLLAFESDQGGKERMNLLVAVLGLLYGLSTEGIWAAALVNPPLSEGDLIGGRNETERERGELVRTLVRVVVAARKRAKELSMGRKESLRVREEDKDGKDTDVVDATVVDVGDEADKIDPELRHVWDVLSLSLGVLANIVDAAGEEEDVKDLLRTIKLDPSCLARRRCARMCGCPASAKNPALEILAELAKDAMEDAPNTVYQTSTTGFLRLLLGFAMLSNPRNESLVLDVLLPSSTSSPADSSTPNPLGAIIDALEDLSKIQQQQLEARRLLLGAPPLPEEEDDDIVAETQLADEPEEDMQLDRGRDDQEKDEGEELVNTIGEMVGRLRRRLAAEGIEGK